MGGGRTYLSAAEAEALPSLFMFNGVKRDGNNRAYVEGEARKWLLLMRIMPFMGTQLPQYYAAADNPYWKEGASKGIAYMLTKLMGIAPRPKAPLRDLGFDVKERKQELEQARRAAEGALKQQEYNE